MKNNLVFAALLMMGAGGFQLATGRASGPNTFGLSIGLIVLGLLGLGVAAAIPKRQKPVVVKRNHNTKLIVAVVVLVVLGALLATVAIMASLEGQ